MSYLDAGLFLACALGVFLGGHIYAACGYVTIYVIAFSCHLIGFLYGVFYLKESRTQEYETKLKPKVCYIFQLKNILQSFKVMKVKRRNGLRHIINLNILLFGAYSIVAAGSVIDPLYARKKFK